MRKSKYILPQNKKYKGGRTNKYGVFFTDKQIERLKKWASEANKNRRDILAVAKRKQPPTFLKHDDRVNFAPSYSSGSIQNIKSKKGIELTINAFKRRASKRFTADYKRIYFQNFKKALQDVFGDVYPERTQKLINILNRKGIEYFANLALRRPDIIALEYIYYGAEELEARISNIEHVIYSNEEEGERQRANRKSPIFRQTLRRQGKRITK